jgi:hypothetical protein
MKPSLPASALALAMLAASAPATASTFTNVSGEVVEFPAGATSFADELVAFTPGLQFEPQLGVFQPLPQYRDGTNTLGVPDMTIQQFIDCTVFSTTETCRFASLGNLGSLTVRFTDNRLTPDGTGAADLWVFVAGPVDPAFVDVSRDGGDWLEVGNLGLSNGVDLDAVGLLPGDLFAFVRLRDAPGGQSSGSTLGADIDAIGAISTTVVPLPAAGWLLASALATLARGRRYVKTELGHGHGLG